MRTYARSTHSTRAGKIQGSLRTKAVQRTKLKDNLATDTTKDFEVSVLNYYPKSYIIAGKVAVTRLRLSSHSCL